MAHNQSATINCKCTDCADAVEQAAADAGADITRDGRIVTVECDSKTFATLHPNLCRLGKGEEAVEVEDDDDDEPVDLDTATVPQLKALCKERDIATTGLKRQELVDAIVAHDSDE